MRQCLNRYNRFILGLVTVISVIIIILAGNGYQTSAKGTANVLWDKKFDGYLGEVKVADNGNVLFFYKADQFQVTADLVACGVNGDYYWNRRFVSKVRDFFIAPSGKFFGYTFLQPNQTGSAPVVVINKDGKELWQLPGGDYLSLSPDEKYLLSYNTGNDTKGIFLYNLKGELAWYSKDLFLLAGQPDDEGSCVYGVQKDKVLFININGATGSYKTDKGVVCSAFDVRRQMVFIYDQEKISCYFIGKGKVWDLKIAMVNKMVTDWKNERLIVYLPGKVLIIPYKDSKGYHNQKNDEEEIIKALNIECEWVRFSGSLKYLASYQKNKLTLFRVGEN
jgi:hypothetical protein